MSQTTSPPTPSSAFWDRFRDLGSLQRPTHGRAIGGVAAGLSRHFDIDPVITRVLFVALAFFGGSGLILYAVLWLTVPAEATGQSFISQRLNRDPRAWTTTGLALGASFAILAFFGSLSWAVPHPFPFLVIAAVVAVGVLALTRRGGPPPGTPVAPSSPAYLSPPRTTPVPKPAPAPPPEPGTAKIVDPYPEGVGAAHTLALPGQPSTAPRSHLFGLAMAASALAVAVVWIVDVATPYDVDPSVYPGVVLAVTAAALILGAWFGRSRGLIAVGLVATVLTAGAAFAGPGPYGDRHASPTTASQLEPSYTMGVGRFTLRLDQISDVAALQGRQTSVEQRLGQLRVVIPSSVAAVVNATVDHGDIKGPAVVQDLDQGGAHAAMRPPPNGRPVVTLDLHVRFGEIRILRVQCPATLPTTGQSLLLWNRGRYAPACK